MKSFLSLLLAAALLGGTAPASFAEPRQVVQGTQVHPPFLNAVERARRFSVFRGQAYMNLNFRSMEIDSRLIPIQMSILSIEKPVAQGEGRKRRDVRVDEGQLIQQRHDYKGDVLFGSAGTGGGAVAGAVLGNVARGFGIGLAGSAAYIVVRKGKEVDLPAQSVMLVRMDNTITVPVTVASNTPAPAVQ